MEKLFLLDAYALIYRSYYAFIRNPRINSKGVNTSAIMGFVNTLNEVLTKENPTHLGVAFDPHGPTFRNEAYPEYKAQREETPEDIRMSVPIIKNILKAWNIPVLSMDGYEADDIIGTLATKAGEKGIETYMLTPDKDYGQLVSDKVFMYRPRHEGGYEVLGKHEICEKYGISSEKQVIDLLALMGDSADNFPGCPGVGEKTAVKLINQFGSIREMLSKTSEIKGALRKKVEENVDSIEMSLFLATIKTDVPINLDMDQLKVTSPDETELRNIFEELEFRTLIDKIFKKQKPKPKTVQLELDLFGDFTNNGTEEEKNESFETLKSRIHDYKLIEKEDDIKKITDYLITFDILTLDTETTSIDSMSAELVGMSFSVKENEAFYIPVPENGEEANKILEIVRPLFENEKSLKVGQNMKYDIVVLANHGIEVRGRKFDTMIAHYLLQPELRHNMDYMAEVYLGYKTIHIEELIGPKGKKQKSMRDLSPAQIYEYAAEDADVTLRLKNVLEPKLRKGGVEDLFYNIEMPLVDVLVTMEMNGVLIDRDSLSETSTIFTSRMNTIEKEIYELAGHEFNIASPRQVGDVLFGELQLMEKPKKTKTGQYVTSEEVLQSLKSKHEIVEKILQHRGLKKLVGTYVDALPTLINPKTGHIHTSFNQTITSTGRLSSSDPNLQNIPVRGEDGKEIRKCFIPEPGCLFFSADYSQIELRVMAHLSGDENMIEAFQNGYDVHAATAANVYQKSREEVTRDERTKAKRANFGIIYGISAWGLSQSLDIDRKEAKALMDGFFATFPKVKQYMDESIRKVQETGYAITVLQRRRYLPDINSHNATVRGFAERNAINAPIQGSAADIIKIAMVNIHRRFKEENLRSKMILQVHDELNFSVFPEEKERVENIVKEEMQGAFALSVPLIADSGWGNNWLEAH